MMVVSILTRRLESDKTYEDFRKVRYQGVGFGTPCKLYSAINALDHGEIIVVGLGGIGPGQDPTKILRTDVKERLDHPLEAVIEPEIGRTFGIVVSEDDSSPAGELEFKPASVNGKEADFEEIAQGLALAKKLVTKAAAERDRAKRIRAKHRRA
jgi:tRNA A37 threonylcarbamoyladenosine dehydratase